MSRQAVLALAAVGSLLACAEWAGPELGGPRLSLVPILGSGGGTVLLNDLDRLHVLVISPAARAGIVVADTTVPVDSAGNARVTLPILLIGSAQTYTVQLEGIRSSDGNVLYSGSDTVTVKASGVTRVDSVPVVYLGPCPSGSGCTITALPQGLSLKQGGSFTMGVIVSDATGLPVSFMPVRLVNVTPGLVSLAGDLTVTALSGTSCGPARIAASIPGVADTLRVNVNAPVTIPPVLFAGDSGLGLSKGVFCNNPNGAGRFNVSAKWGFGDVNPRYSPDRQRVAYTYDSTGAAQLWVASWAGDTNALVVSDTLGASHPRWSPNGLHLGYQCGARPCVILDATPSLPLLSQSPRRVFNDVVPTRPTGSGSFAWDPRSPDRLVFALDSLTNDAIPKTTSALYTASFNGAGVTQLTPQPLDFGGGVLRISDIDWSPRGDVIVFSAADTLSRSKLYAINRDGTGLRQLTKGADSDFRPVVSPDGAQVLFLRNLASSGCSVDYWRIGIDGAGEQAVTNEGFCDVITNGLGHDWSPDGTEIVLVGAGPTGQYNGFMVYRLPAATTAATYVTTRVPVRGLDSGAFSNDMQPSWRP